MIGTREEEKMDNKKQIKGAVYFPSRAYNAYQTWLYFDEAEVARDFGYAQSIGLNALRIFTSYEFWQEKPEVFWAKFEALLNRAAEKDILVLPILFENCGREPSRENMLDRNPYTAACVQSPGRKITGNPELWEKPAAYTSEFMRRYADDERLIAIETMNEPHEETGDVSFAQFITQIAFGLKKRVPLSIGCISLHHNLYFAQWLGVYQFHDNFPSELNKFKKELQDAASLQKLAGKQVWISEWQRLRESGPGWDQKEIPEGDKVPMLSSLAEAVYASGLGSFFWSLMVKPAYLPAQRINGTINGLFHEDGSVYSAVDYLAVSGKENAPEERTALPSWYMDDMKKYSGDH